MSRNRMTLREAEAFERAYGLEPRMRRLKAEQRACRAERREELREQIDGDGFIARSEVPRAVSRGNIVKVKGMKGEQIVVKGSWKGVWVRPHDGPIKSRRSGGDNAGTKIEESRITHVKVRVR